MVASAEVFELDWEPAAWPRRIPLFGVHLDAVTMEETVSQIKTWLREPYQECRYVVTPNVDHVVLLQESMALHAAYADAALVLADGWPVVAASRLLRRPLPARVAGSDLVPRLFEQSQLEPIRVFLLGAAPGVANRAAANIRSRWRGVEVVGTYSPPLGFERSPEENDRILNRVAEAEPDLLVVGFGAPKQEIWVHTHRRRLRAKIAICAGATIDFLAGEKRRAPRWMRRFGLEWLHRMLTEPRRMVRRYTRDAWIFPRLVCREWFAGS